MILTNEILILLYNVSKERRCGSQVQLWYENIIYLTLKFSIFNLSFDFRNVSEKSLYYICIMCFSKSFQNISYLVLILKLKKNPHVSFLKTNAMVQNKHRSNSAVKFAGTSKISFVFKQPKYRWDVRSKLFCIYFLGCDCCSNSYRGFS